MSKNRKNISWFGLILIFLGLVMLLDRFDVLNVEFSTIFWPMIMLMGLAIVGRGFAQNRRGKVYWGTVLFLYAVFFVLRSIDYFEIYSYTFFPASFMIFGIAFFMMYLCNLREWPLLLPSIILLGVGSLILMNEFGYLYQYELFDIVRLYWPVILILFGVTIILRKKYSASPQTNPEASPPPPVG